MYILSAQHHRSIQVITNNPITNHLFQNTVPHCCDSPNVNNANNGWKFSAITAPFQIKDTFLPNTVNCWGTTLAVSTRIGYKLILDQINHLTTWLQMCDDAHVIHNTRVELRYNFLIYNMHGTVKFDNCPIFVPLLYPSAWLESKMLASLTQYLIQYLEFFVATLAYNEKFCKNLLKITVIFFKHFLQTNRCNRRFF